MAAPVAKNKRHSEYLNRLIASYELRGHSGEEIARRLKADHGITMSARQVQARIKKMNAAMQTERADKIAREERRINHLFAEALDAWEASKKAQETTITEKRDGGGDGAAIKASVRKESSSGEAAHLANAMRASESLRKLLGLDAPTRNQEEPLPPVDWSQVPDAIQIQFLDGELTLAQVIAYVAANKPGS